MLRLIAMGAVAALAACSSVSQAPHRANWNGPPETCSAYAKGGAAYRACLERDEAARAVPKFVPTS